MPNFFRGWTIYLSGNDVNVSEAMLARCSEEFLAKDGIGGGPPLLTSDDLRVIYIVSLAFFCIRDYPA